MIQGRGEWRVYFNQHAAAPMVWCVAPVSGGWEIAVRGVNCACRTMTVYEARDANEAGPDRPVAWILATGILTVTDNGYATIE